MTARPSARSLRSAVAAIENAEAVPVHDGPTPTASADVAGAAVGLGATEAQRRLLGEDAERSLVLAEVQSLVEAEAAYAAAGDRDRAQSAAVGVAVLTAVLDEVGDDSR